MKMVSMKLPPPKKGDTADSPQGCGMDGDELYPYGLRISLQDEQLSALGLKELPKVSDTMTITATVSVVGVSSSQVKDGEDRSVQLQITDMALDGQKPSAADKLYGGSK